MRVVTWNVNSIRTRLPRVLAMLDREQPDIVCLQETKTLDAGFPSLAFEERGYEALVWGQQTYNGVAILSREPIEEIARGFPGDPTPSEARLLGARIGDLSVLSAYVINGKTLADPAYELKLTWLRALRAWIADTFDPERPLIIAGDFNVAPDDRDVWDASKVHGATHVSDAERKEITLLQEWGFADLFRLHESAGGIFSWWDYRGGAFHKKEGMRIDLMFGTEPLARRCTEVRIDRNERRPKAGEGAPSDHAPVIATFED